MVHDHNLPGMFLARPLVQKMSSSDFKDVARVFCRGLTRKKTRSLKFTVKLIIIREVGDFQSMVNFSIE